MPSELAETKDDWDKLSIYDVAHKLYVLRGKLADVYERNFVAYVCNKMVELEGTLKIAKDGLESLRDEVVTLKDGVNA